MATMNSRGTDASVGITVMTTATRALCILPPCFSAVSRLSCAVLLKSSVHFEEKTTIISDQIVISRRTVRLFYEDFFPPNFQLHSRQSAKLAVPDFFSKFPCVRVDQRHYVYSPGWACDLHILKSMSLVSYKQERKKVWFILLKIPSHLV